MKAIPFLVAALIAQTAQAADLSCNITRTNKYNNNDVATHSVVEPIDLSMRNGPVIAEGYLRSFVLPRSAGLRYSFLLTDRRMMTTLLTLETVDLTSGRVVISDAQHGSISGAPATVTNKFEMTDRQYSYEISCDVQN